MNDEDLPPRVKAAEQRQRFRNMLTASSLGTPNAQRRIAQSRRESTALPDRWIRVVDLPKLLEIYQERRETWQEDHETAMTYVLAEIDYEPDRSDIHEE